MPIRVMTTTVIVIDISVVVIIIIAIVILEVFDAMSGDFTTTYTWSDGNVYTLHFIQQEDGRFRIEILQQPDNGSRDARLRVTGRMEENGHFFINTNETYPRKPDTLRLAEMAAANWMFHTGRYIETGVSPYPCGNDDDIPPGCILWLG